jgi:thiol-disulfide isomerase/thioredoxin
MKQSMITLLSLLIGVTLSAQGIEFFHGSWKEAVAAAKEQDKIIFVDGYAVWCGPCKRMAKNVFTDDRVGEFYNENFINVKMDMERGEGLTFRKKYPVSAYPTLYYIDYTGEVVQKIRGAQQVDAFINLGRQALSKIDRSGQFAEAYEQGDRDPELVYNYIKALNKAGKSSLKIANDYLRDQENLRTEKNLRIILEGTTQADSKIFEWLIQYRDEIEALESEAAVNQRILNACRTTVKKGIEFDYRQLVDNAIDKMKKHYPEAAKAFELEAEMEFALAAKDAKSYAKGCKEYAKKVAEDPEELHRMVQTLVKHFRKDGYAMKQAEDLAQQAAESGNSYGYYLTFASVLAMNGKKSEALEAAGKSLELAKTEGDQAVHIVERFMEKISS